MAESGTIKKFFSDKGFGFVTPDAGGDDVFVHVKDNPGLEESAPNGGEACKYDSEWDDRKGKYKGTNCTVSGGGGGGGGGGYGGGKGDKGKGGDNGYSPYGGKGW